MEMIAKAKVLGASEYKFNNDEGANVEGYHLFVEVDLASEQGCYGFRSQSYKANKAIIDVVKAGKFPFNAELQLRASATRGKQTMEVMSCKNLDVK